VPLSVNEWLYRFDGTGNDRIRRLIGKSRAPLGSMELNRVNIMAVLVLA
jgi:hypothetical protein